MKKLDFFKYAAILAAFFVVLFVTGCGDNVNPDIDGNGNPDDNSGNNPGSITIPTEPPSVSGGSLTKTGGEPVTQANLNDFIDVFCSALDVYYRPRGVRALPEEYHKYDYYISGSYTLYGDYSGRAEMTEKDGGEETKTIDIGYQSATYKLFDFSNSGELFLGGAVGWLWTEDTNDFDGHTTKAKGRINFAGKYRGTVFFDDVAFKRERIYNSEYDWDYGYERVRGSFYVQSAGGQRIDLDGSLFEDFIDVWSNNADKGNEPITITMPAVPSAPNGSLTERGGNNYSVKRENVSDFLTAFKQEFEYYNVPRAVNGKETGERLEHGRNSGYYKSKSEDTIQVNNSGQYYADTESVEYNDYSNNGVLYFGGGYGKASFTHIYESTRQSYRYTTKTVIKGTVKFNGEFKGELVFNDFEYKYEYGSGSGTETKSSNTHVSGSVKIGTLDISDEYMREVIR